MRRSAYLKALEEAQALPNNIPEMFGYFNDGYSPREEAIKHIKLRARLDIDALFERELIDVLAWKPNPKDDHAQTPEA